MRPGYAVGEDVVGTAKKNRQRARDEVMRGEHDQGSGRSANGVAGCVAPRRVKNLGQLMKLKMRNLEEASVV